jgi:hypothetical protein
MLKHLQIKSRRPPARAATETTPQEGRKDCVDRGAELRPGEAVHAAFFLMRGYYKVSPALCQEGRREKPDELPKRFDFFPGSGMIPS